MKGKYSKKIGKKGMAILAVLIIGAVIGGATAFTYFMNTQSQHTVGKLWQIKDNSLGTWTEYAEMGDVNIVFDTTDMVGGDEESFLFNISLSGNSNANRDIVFDMTNTHEADGVTLTITEVGVGVVNDTDAVEWTPNSEKQFEFKVSLDEYTPAETYIVTLNLEKN